jgi:hypothetical protein
VQLLPTSLQHLGEVVSLLNGCFPFGGTLFLFARFPLLGPQFHCWPSASAAVLVCCLVHLYQHGKVDRFIVAANANKKSITTS